MITVSTRRALPSRAAPERPVPAPPRSDSSIVSLAIMGLLGSRLRGCGLAPAEATLEVPGGAANREFSPCEQAVLHGEHRRARARRHANLRVGVLYVAVGRLRRDAELARDLLGLQPPREEPYDLDLALGQPRRSLATRCARGWVIAW